MKQWQVEIDSQYVVYLGQADVHKGIYFKAAFGINIFIFISTMPLKVECNKTIDENQS